ncbi:unnamed protein product [Fraxinus pennsylvanica]|uniref:Uncharacterized protein n=1 Tax=Fraxinus pennsylvanica TaxID=56036 RepID=A0AAD2A849_9LAMI|nr:unnamed protein product [Fraxinus pennsylvanica]
MAIERIIMATLIATSLISMASAIPGTATFYTTYVPSACYGFEDRGTMIAAANPSLYNNGGACGQRFLSPLSIVPLVSLVGFGLYEFGFPRVPFSLSQDMPCNPNATIYSQPWCRLAVQDQNDGYYPSNCESSNPYDQRKILDLISRIQQSWPMLACPSNSGSSFWSHAWEKHGTCSESVLDQHGYFKSALNLKSQIIPDLHPCGQFWFKPN